MLYIPVKLIFRIAFYTLRNAPFLILLPSRTDTSESADAGIPRPLPEVLSQIFTLLVFPLSRPWIGKTIALPITFTCLTFAVARIGILVVHRRTPSFRQKQTGNVSSILFSINILKTDTTKIFRIALRPTLSLDVSPKIMFHVSSAFFSWPTYIFWPFSERKINTSSLRRTPGDGTCTTIASPLPRRSPF